MKTIYTLFLIFSLQFCADAQIDCPETLEICDGYFYLDEGFDTTGGYVIKIEHLGSVFIFFDLTPDNGVIDFSFSQDFSSGGIYKIYSLLDQDVLICNGLYTTTACNDYLIFPDTKCFYEQPTEFTACHELGLEAITYTRYYCIGDTSRVHISSNQFSIEPDIYAPFSLDRLQLNNGTVISADEFGFDLVWDVLGEECVLLNTPLTDQENLTGVPIRVEANKKAEIFTNNMSISAIDICIDENINLTSNIDDDKLYWITNHGKEFNQPEVNLSFAEPGTYSVIMGSNALCNCTIPDTLLINVLPGETAGIECTGTICADTEVTYYSAYECDTYLWSVSNEGTIIDGGGPSDYFITILWNNGPSGYINLSIPGCIDMACSDMINVEIPIIDGLSTIVGPVDVCYGEESYYSIEDFQGTSVEWSLDGPGYIVNGKNSNQTLIKWANESTKNEAILKVIYENCNLGCADSTSIVISLREQIFIQNEINKYCSEADLNLSNNLGLNVDWTILNPDGSESNFNNIPNLSTVLTEVGTYIVSLSNPETPTCNPKDEIRIELLENPPPPSNLLGPTFICLNKTTQYEIPNLGDYDVVTWEVFDGSLSNPIFSSTSRELTYVWTSQNGPYQISAKIQNSITGCFSESTSIIINSGISIEGPIIACLAQEKIYTVLDYEGGTIEWNINPSSSGSIIYNQGNSATVIWLENGTHSIEANYCDNTDFFEVNVPSFEIDITNGIACYGEKTEVEIITSAGSLVSIKQYPENNLVSSSLISELIAGEYLIEATSPYGCYLSKEIVITELDSFDVGITSPGPFSFCMPHPPIFITATEFGIGYTYEWYWNNNLLPESTNELEATDYGSYFVEVTDEYGCSERSNSITLSEPISIPGPPLDSEMIDVDCTTKSFSVLEPYESTEFNWSFGDGAFASGTTVNHTFTKAGYYKIVVRGNGGCISTTGTTCDSEFSAEPCETDILNVVIPVVADFDFGPSCIGEDVEFIDISTKIPTITGLIYSWNFGDVSSGASNTSSEVNPIHRFDNAQSYNVALTINHPSTGCITSIIKTINIASIPEVSIDFNTENCLGSSFDFTGTANDPLVVYYWEFGDTINERPQISREQNPQHSFSNTGEYLVKLTVENSYGCTNTTAQLVTISENLLTGEIETNTIYPKCPDEPVILTAPLADTYLWSNDETTRQITVIDPDTYTVTVTDVIGCTYVPFPHLITDYTISNALIYATRYGDWGQRLHYQELTVCKGQKFNLQMSKLPNVISTWTGININGEVDEKLDYDRFAELPEGIYDFYVNLIDTVGNCSKNIGPFELTIIENPTDPIIISDTEIPCEGENITVSISNVEPDVTYTWNTGATGTSITATDQSYFSVTATNFAGCESISKFLFVRPTPNVNSWLTGCMEVCFPHEICLSVHRFSKYKYELVKDGIVIGQISNSDEVFNATEPGEYQLQVTDKSFGCSSLSDVLNITAAPDEHTLSGIVYFDENENNTYDAVEQLLENIPVNLYNGNTSVDQTVTDINGYYEFDPVDYANLTVVIDPSTSGLLLEGDLDSLLIYNECIEDKGVNFPLIEACILMQSDSTYRVCPGNGVFIEGAIYFADEVDTITYMSVKGCDSLFIFEIKESVMPEVELESAGSCQENSDGDIAINIINGQNLLFSIDGGLNYVSDLGFNGLSDGEYYLNILDAFGCAYGQAFSIPLHPEVIFEIETSVICGTLETGLVTISTTASGMQFSLDDNLNFDPTLVYTSVDTGYHMMYAMSIEGCIDSTSFIMESFIEPTLLFTTITACEDINLGELMIDSSYLGSLFSIDGIDYSTDLVFSNLTVGQYILYYQLYEECIFEFPFEMLESSEPNLDLNLISSCEDENNGQLIINTEDPSLIYSLNEIDYSENTTFENLSGEGYTLYVQTSAGCMYKYQFDIPVLQFPSVDASTKNSCFSEETGSIIINSLQEGSSVSINGAEFTTQLNYENLSSGKYIIQIKGQNQCVIEAEVEILEIPELAIDVSDYEIDCIAEPITIAPKIISSSGLINYLWSDGSTEAQYFTNESEMVSVTISDECHALSFEWNLNFLNDVNEDNIFVPNIFSPNEDSFNDCFITTLHRDVQLLSYSHIIFDRWGNKMFTSESLSDCWDGTYNGEPVAPGVYVYISKLLIDGCEGSYSVRKVGDVTVVR